MYSGMGDGLVTGMLIIAGVCVFLGWAIPALFSWLYADDEYRTTERLEPIKIELEINNGIDIDTVYIYEIK